MQKWLNASDNLYSFDRGPPLLSQGNKKAQEKRLIHVYS